MGKIQDAVNKARDSKRGSQAPLRAAESHMSSLRPDQQQFSFVGPSPLEKSAHYAPLDMDFLKQQRVILPDQTDAAVTAYKMLRTRTLQRLRSNNWHRIAISSARRNAGKTLTAINTAISLSSEPNQYIILVDLDLRRPTIAKSLGISRDIGVTDVLTGKASVEDIAVRTDIERLLVLPNFTRLDNSSEMMTSSRMIEFVSEVSSRANSTIVIFDLPPLLEADDLLAFSPLIDALLLVVAERETKRSEVQHSMALVEELDILGCVLNKSNSETSADGYYY
jgi:capsular exopolysaccharide synthesis family protein